MKSADQMTDAKPQRKISVSLERWMSEIQKADARLRRFPDRNGRSNPNQPRSAAMRWVLNFAHVNLDNLSEGDLTNLRHELQHISHLETHALTPEDLECFAKKSPSWPPKKDLVFLQQWLQNIIGPILHRDHIGFDEPYRHCSIRYDQEKRRWIITDFTEDHIRTEMFTLIREHIHHLHRCRCEDCEHPLFLKDRQNQEFCSNRCKWRHAQRHRPDRTIPPERFGKRGRPAGLGSPSSSKLATTKGGTHDKKKRTR